MTFIPTSRPQLNDDEAEALGRVLLTFPGTKVGKCEPPEKELSVLEAADEVIREERAEGRSSWRSIDLAEFMGIDDGRDAPTLLLRSDDLAFYYAGKRNELHGPPESGKSWVALLVVLEVIRRGEVAVWIDFEDSPRAIVTRLLALGAEEDAILQNFRYIQPAELLTPEAVIDLRLELAGAVLVVVDAVNEAMTTSGLNPNDNRDIAIWYGVIPHLASLAGCASLMLDHVAKDPEQRRGATGGAHKTAALDGASYSLDAKTPFGRGSSGLLVLRLGKDRPGYVRGRFGAGAHPPVAEITMDATDPTAIVVGVKPPAATRDSEEWRPTRLMEKVSKFLESQDDPVSQKVVDDEVKGRRQYVIEALDKLESDGFVERSTGEHGAHLYASARPFREDAT
jgi:hypothetical protein